MQDIVRCLIIEFFNSQITQHYQLIFFTTMSTYEHENDATLYIAIFENTVLRKLNVKNQMTAS